MIRVIKQFQAITIRGVDGLPMTIEMLTTFLNAFLIIYFPYLYYYSLTPFSLLLIASLSSNELPFW